MKNIFWIYLLPILMILVSTPVFVMSIAITLVFRVILFIGAGISHIGLYGMLQGIEGGDMMRDAIKRTAIIALAKHSILTEDTHEA